MMYIITPRATTANANKTDRTMTTAPAERLGHEDEDEEAWGLAVELEA